MIKNNEELQVARVQTVTILFVLDEFYRDNGRAPEGVNVTLYAREKGVLENNLEDLIDQIVEYGQRTGVRRAFQVTSLKRIVGQEKQRDLLLKTLQNAINWIDPDNDCEATEVKQIRKVARVVAREIQHEKETNMKADLRDGPLRPQGRLEVPCSHPDCTDASGTWYIWIQCDDPRLPGGPFFCDLHGGTGAGAVEKRYQPQIQAPEVLGAR